MKGRVPLFRLILLEIFIRHKANRALEDSLGSSFGIHFFYPAKDIFSFVYNHTFERILRQDSKYKHTKKESHLNKKTNVFCTFLMGASYK
jgi:hypothetical protein